MEKVKCPYCSNEVDVEELLSVDTLELLENFKQVEKYSTNCPYCDKYVRVDVRYEVCVNVNIKMYKKDKIKLYNRSKLISRFKKSFIL